MRRRRTVVALALLAVLAAGCPARNQRQEGPSRAPRPGSIRQITAVVETEPVPSSGDAADDPAIWVHPTDPSQSTVIATDKRRGLAVYDLSGRQLQFLAGGRPNNVDLRDGFVLRGTPVSLVVASDKASDSLRFLGVDLRTRMLVDVTARPIEVGSASGLCMYRSLDSGRFYAFSLGENSRAEQWELVDNGSGKVDGRRVRGPWDVGGESEGCVADDELGHLYIGEEERAIWKYGAEPSDSTRQRTRVDATNGRLVADVEGLAIVYGPGRTGVLLASSQGDNSFLLYRREGANDFLAKLRVKGGPIDGCEETDGIDVTSAPLGPRFPLGLFVCQDGSNPGSRQNFKLVPLERLLAKVGG